MSPNDADGRANNAYPDQTAPREEQSDLGLHCLPRHICPKTKDHYGNFLQFSVKNQLWVLAKAILMNNHKVCFYGEIWIFIHKL